MANTPKLSYGGLLTSRGSAELLRILSDTGFIEIQNAIPDGLDDGALAAAEEFFRLPNHEKLSTKAETFVQPGFSPYGQTRALDTGIPNLLESWVVSPFRPDNIPTHCLALWYTLAAYGRHLRLIGENAVAAIDHAWDARGNLLAAMSHKPANMHFFHYPRALLGTMDGARRQSLHTDSSIVTVLPRATQPGLTIYNSGNPVDVLAARGSVLIISGTVLDFLTSGSVRACLHAVDTPNAAESAHDRISATYFVNAASNGVLFPVSPGGEAIQDAPPLDVEAFSEGYRRRIIGHA
jgi:isopenicillin N synthase-like dioxygenase